MAERCPDHNAECNSPLHTEHLCYFISQGFHLSNEREYKWMVEEPQFKCQHCGRAARCEDNLCEPEKL
ncbi:MAG: hypothetical protein ACYSYU_10715 [Planctomycetota bacterium]|jgi:hypothetical protein